MKKAAPQIKTLMRLQTPLVLYKRNRIPINVWSQINKVLNRSSSRINGNRFAPGNVKYVLPTNKYYGKKLFGRDLLAKQRMKYIHGLSDTKLRKVLKPFNLYAKERAFLEMEKQSNILNYMTGLSSHGSKSQYHKKRSSKETPIKYFLENLSLYGLLHYVNLEKKNLVYTNNLLINSKLNLKLTEDYLDLLDRLKFTTHISFIAALRRKKRPLFGVTKEVINLTSKSFTRLLKTTTKKRKKRTFTKKLKRVKNLRLVTNKKVSSIKNPIKIRKPLKTLRKKIVTKNLAKRSYTTSFIRQTKGTRLNRIRKKLRNIRYNSSEFLFEQLSSLSDRIKALLTRNYTTLELLQNTNLDSKERTYIKLVIKKLISSDLSKIHKYVRLYIMNLFPLYHITYLPSHNNLSELPSHVALDVSLLKLKHISSKARISYDQDLSLVKTFSSIR